MHAPRVQILVQSIMVDCSSSFEMDALLIGATVIIIVGPCWSGCCDSHFVVFVLMYCKGLLRGCPALRPRKADLGGSRSWFKKTYFVILMLF